jgi:predicted metalloprotease with PDZ domain
LWNRYGRRDIGLPEDGFEALAAGIGGEPARESLAAAVDGTEDPDLESLFADCGLLLKFRQGEGAQDRGGTPPKQTRPRVGIGAVIVAHPAGLKLSMVPDGQPAQAAGLAPEDVIIALDRIQVNPATLESLLGRYDAGDQVTVSYFRGDELRETELRLEWLPLDHCYIEMAPEADAAQLQLRRAWLGE